MGHKPPPPPSNWKPGADENGFYHTQNGWIGSNAGFMAGPNLDTEFPIPPGHPDHVPPGGGGYNNMDSVAGVYRGSVQPRGADYYRMQRGVQPRGGLGGSAYAGQAANPHAAQLERLQRQFQELYRTNPGAAFALYEQGSGANRGAMQGWIRNNVFGGDVNAMNQWKNTSAYTSANNYKYDPTTGRMSDLQGNVAHQGFGSTVANKPGSWADRRAQAAAKGGNGTPYTGGGTTPGTGTGAPIDPYAGMTMLYRDNTGMLHDPGDNPVNTPTTPTSPVAPPANPDYYRRPSRRDMGMKPNKPTPGLNNGTPFNPNFNMPNGQPATNVPSGPVAGPATNPVGPRTQPTPTPTPVLPPTTPTTTAPPPNRYSYRTNNNY